MQELTFEQVEHVSGGFFQADTGGNNGGNSGSSNNRNGNNPCKGGSWQKWALCTLLFEGLELLKSGENSPTPTSPDGNGEEDDEKETPPKPKS
ncbi:hypothetical protein [Alishewanella longhuensis]